jgi:hypothetical protein
LISSLATSTLDGSRHGSPGAVARPGDSASQVFVVVVDGNGVAAGSPELDHNLAMLVDPSSRPIDIPHAYAHVIDCRAKSSQSEVQTAVDVLAKSCRNFDTVAGNRESHGAFLARSVTLLIIPPYHYPCKEIY